MIQGTADYPATELRLRHLLEGKTALEPDLGHTLAALNVWAVLVQVQGAEDCLNAMGVSPAVDGRKLIAVVSGRLSVDEHGTTRYLLWKSLQETLFCSVEVESNLSNLQFAAKLVELLRKGGVEPFLRRFLSFHVFNVVWFQTQECFRGLSRTNDLFMAEMEGVQRTCRQIVSSEWKSLGVQCPLSLYAAEQLTDRIGRRLCG